MFAAPLELWAKWDPKGVPATHRFLSRIWNLAQEYLASDVTVKSGTGATALLRVIHPAIQKATGDIEQHKYNTAIAAMMKCVNDLYELKAKSGFADGATWLFVLESLAALVAPFAPHTADELWHELGHEDSVQRDSWPQWDDAYLVGDTITLAVQVNGKVRAEIAVAPDADKQTVEKLALEHEKIQKLLDGNAPKRVIVVPGRLVNIVL
jgi:leucyl-tRNA synthetase